METAPKPIVLSTAGAIPVKNDKGQVTMEKVKVARYITGKRPEYAPYSSDEEEEGAGEAFPPRRQDRSPGAEGHEDDGDEGEGGDFGQPGEMMTMTEDRRVRRILEAQQQRRRGRKRTRSDGEDDDDDEEDEDDDGEETRIAKHRRAVETLDGRDLDEEGRRVDAGEGSDEEADLSEGEIERKREMLKRRALSMKEEKELMDLAEESPKEEDDPEEDSEYEECTDTDEEEEEEDEEESRRLKPMFVRKEDRVTIHDKERQLQKEKDQEYEQRRIAHERRQETLRMLEAELRREAESKAQSKADADELDTEDENEEEAYEAWKVRELKRLKRDKEERERYEKEKQEIERMRNMTEEERRQELKANPKLVTNRAAKGKYKFLQKYYHRGVFYLDEEDQIFKRDYTAPTLEDHFNKTVLPKVMQVKNFGRSGRTKYTHLVDQDTTQFDSPWMSDTATNLKFHTNKGGGMKQQLDLSKQRQN